MITSVQENMKVKVKVKVTNSEIRERMQPLLEITANTTDKDILVKLNMTICEEPLTNSITPPLRLLLVGKLLVSSKMTLCNEQLPAERICTRS